MSKNINKKLNNYKYLLFLISSCVVLLDQISKYYAKILLSETNPTILNTYNNLILVFNHGIAFSLFSKQSIIQKYTLIIIPLLIILYILYYIIRTQYKFFNGVAYSLILGGALGNLIDRILFDKVTDFIDWHVGMYHWPTFNMADSFVCIGVAIIIIDGIKNK